MSHTRIGLFGGSFDPVHNAHVALARLALEQLQLDVVRWLPAGQPWQKSRSLAPPQHRLAMVRLATEGEPRFIVDASEIDRGGPTYTIDTVRSLQAAGQPPAEWVLILGQDQYRSFDTWRDWPELLQRLTLAVAGRAGEPAVAPPAVAALAHRVEVLPLPPMAVSSTDIRDRLARGESVDQLVPAPVARYIAQHQLYK